MLQDSAATNIRKPRIFRSAKAMPPDTTIKAPVRPTNTDNQRQRDTCSFRNTRAMTVLNNGDDCDSTLEAPALTQCWPVLIARWWSVTAKKPSTRNNGTSLSLGREILNTSAMTAMNTDAIRKRSSATCPGLGFKPHAYSHR